MEVQGIKQFQDGSAGCESQSGWEEFPWGKFKTFGTLSQRTDADDKGLSNFRNVGNNMAIMICYLTTFASIFSAALSIYVSASRLEALPGPYLNMANNSLILYLIDKAIPVQA